MILFINSSETDYGQDILYSGLVQRFGRSKILDWPFNLGYYKSRRVYPRNLGDCGLDGILRRLGKSAWSTKMDGDFFKSVKVVILGSCKGKCFHSYLQIADKIPATVPVVFNDGGDFVEIGGHLKASEDFHLLEKALKIRPFDLILKREYIKEKISLEPNADAVMPFPFGFNFSVLPKTIAPMNEKKYQVSFWAVESHPIRTQALALIEDKWDCRENGTQRKQQFHKYKRKGSFYLEELKRCEVVLNFRGVGWDTLRYWEVPAIGGFMISEKPGIEIPNDFVDEEHLLFCKEDLSDLIDKVEYSLANPKKTAQMGLRAREHAIKFHSSLARAEQLGVALKERFGVTL